MIHHVHKWQEVNSGSNALVELDSKAKMVVEPIRWYNLDTYTYGARLPDTMAKNMRTTQTTSNIWYF